MTEFDSPKSAFDTDTHLRPIVNSQISMDQLELRIMNLTGLKNKNADARVIATPEFPWLFEAGEDLRLRPREDLQQGIRNSYGNVVGFLKRHNRDYLTASVKGSRVGVAMEGMVIYATFNSGEENSSTVFSYEPRDDKVAWSAVAFKGRAENDQSVGMDDETDLLCETPMPAYMAIKTVELIIDNVPCTF